ncbi:MAG: heavy metal translocating P-type ATPase [Bdellovibrionota bacterium]
MSLLKKIWKKRTLFIAGLALISIATHLIIHSDSPLFITFVIGGSALIWELLVKAFRLEFGADMLAGISIITALLLGEYLAGTIVILMLSGGEALEAYATANASSVLKALAKRIPSIAHKKVATTTEDISVSAIRIDDLLIVYPHETCPVDGIVVEGHGSMDESYLTGEPFRVGKTAGSTVISGSVNDQSALTIRATKSAEDSRYSKIMQVMHDSEQKKPHLRRLGDQLGAYYTPLALLIAGIAWAVSGDATRFLAVLVVATPCPLLIAIPIAIIGSISLAAKRAIIVKSPVALEQISRCRTAIFDKTGTLTYGEPKLIELVSRPEFQSDDLLSLVASLERYSKHPLAGAILKAAEEKKLKLQDVSEVHEVPGQGLIGVVAHQQIEVTSRKKLGQKNLQESEKIPPTQGGLECIVVVGARYAGILRFHDAPRDDSKSFISHLGPQHSFDKVIILSGDRESEVKYLAEQVGIKETYAQKSPEEKLAIVSEETTKAKTLYVGDGINDAPAMMASSVGIAMGQNSEITSEAASVVILDNSLKKVDEFIHISRRMRTIALQSAIGGMTFSALGMVAAAFGLLSPVHGAITQELIDVFAILNALRVAIRPKVLSDFHE